jgi:hypothetical protein
VFLEGSPAQIKARVAKAGHCSVLIKVSEWGKERWMAGHHIRYSLDQCHRPGTEQGTAACRSR